MKCYGISDNDTNDENTFEQRLTSLQVWCIIRAPNICSIFREPIMKGDLAMD